MATKITSIKKLDKITALNHNSGNINLASGAILSIGGLQYTTDSVKTVALPTLTANTRYQVYAVISGGDVILVISTDENSVGPVGYSSWKLVGSLQSNGIGPVGFGSFLNISESRSSNSSILFNTVWTAPTVNPTLGNGGLTSRYQIKDDRIIGSIDLDVGSSTTFGTGTWQFAIPENLVVDTLKIKTGLPGSIVGELCAINGSSSNNIGIATYNGFNIIGFLNGNANNVNASQPFAWANGNSFRLNFSLPIVGWSNTPIQDL